jgi:hypothetical protein
MTFTDEVGRASKLARAIISEYAAWSDKVRYGDELHDVYRQVFDFLNFRVETADSCLLLLDNRRVGDALGLCRSLLEHHLLFMLTCRGTKFFVAQDLSNQTESEFKRTLAAKQAELEAGIEQPYIAVEKHPRMKRRLLYVYEGLASPDPSLPEFRIPLHFFRFRQFNPEFHRLKDENYFRYYEPTEAQVEADEKYREDQDAWYRFYLSYDALLYCLKINGLADDALQARIEAHYTFLGEFLHPTHESARKLHNNANTYDGKTRIGLDQQYTEAAVLLGYLYVCYLLAALLDEAASFFEHAPKKYVTEPGTAGLRALTARVPSDFPYFWFLSNDPPAWDRYNFFTHHPDRAERNTWGNYEHVPLQRVLFNQHIYDHLKMSYGFWEQNK